MTMDSKGSDISKIMVKFNRQITRVKKKEEAVKEQRGEWQNEKTAFEKLKEAHDVQVKVHSEALVQQKTLKDTLESEITFSGKFQDIIGNEISLDSTETDDEGDGELAQLQADVVECEAAVSESRSVLKAAEATLVDLDAEVKQLESKLPSLEKEKKEAAVIKEFRVAAKLSKEI